MEHHSLADATDSLDPLPDDPLTQQSRRGLNEDRPFWAPFPPSEQNSASFSLQDTAAHRFNFGKLGHRISFRQNQGSRERAFAQNWSRTVRFQPLTLSSPSRDN